MTQEILNKVELIQLYLGEKAFLQELLQAMSTKELVENLEHIAQMHDIDLEDAEDGFIVLHRSI